jgi:hypothetical protein
MSHPNHFQLKANFFQVARVISNLLAAAILTMRGVDGKAGWFWLFLIEGLLTFVIGVIVSIFTIYISFILFVLAKFVFVPIKVFISKSNSASQSILYLPQSPTSTKSILWPRKWYTEREEIIMINVRLPISCFGISLTTTSVFSAMTLLRVLRL